MQCNLINLHHFACKVLWLWWAARMQNLAFVIFLLATTLISGIGSFLKWLRMSDESIAVVLGVVVVVGIVSATLGKRIATAFRQINTKAARITLLIAIGGIPLMLLAFWTCDTYRLEDRMRYLMLGGHSGFWISTMLFWAGAIHFVTGVTCAVYYKYTIGKLLAWISAGE